MNRMLFRSYLYAPGNSEKLLGKVFEAGADAVVLDLEDAVPPEQKPQAREMVASVLRAVAHFGKGGPAVYVRLNAVSSGFWREDLSAISSPIVRGVRVGKAETAEEIRAVSEQLADCEAQLRVHPGSLKIVPMIESALGVLNAAEIARHPRIEALCFGQADFVNDIGADPDEAEMQTLYARSQLVLVSRAAHINPPIASVHTNIRDADGLRVTTEAARRLGFFGRSCIHPSQIPIIHELFDPTQQQLSEAQKIVEAFDQYAATGVTAFVMENGQFVDAPIVERARGMLALADSLKEKEKTAAGE